MMYINMVLLKYFPAGRLKGMFVVLLQALFGPLMACLISFNHLFYPGIFHDVYSHGFTEVFSHRETQGNACSIVMTMNTLKMTTSWHQWAQELDL